MKYFKMKELGCRCGCRMPAEARANMEALVNNVLNPAREGYGKAVYVNSGYRCVRHNQRVGGVKRSQHLKGEAADVWCADNGRLRRLIEAQGRFDQMIVYDTFLHVSHKRAGVNRRQVLRKTSAGCWPAGEERK